jgi:hypothetical protein
VRGGSGRRIREERERNKMYENTPFRPRHATSRTPSLKARTEMRRLGYEGGGWPGFVAASREEGRAKRRPWKSVTAGSAWGRPYWEYREYDGAGAAERQSAYDEQRERGSVEVESEISTRNEKEYKRIHIPSRRKPGRFRGILPASLVRMRNNALDIVTRHLRPTWKIRRVPDFLGKCMSGESWEEF